MNSSVNIVIPTYNRAHMVGSAIEAALSQTYKNTYVTVVDDGSTDDTIKVLSHFTDHPQFRCIVLDGNVGTAQAKNVGIAFNDCDYISFNDSDDKPHPHKIERQIGVARRHDIRADPVLNWSLSDVKPKSRLSIDLVVHEHELVLGDGSRHHIRRALSLVDDAFPNMQLAAGVPGDWILINCGLFDGDVFTRLGGFSNCVEEDRDLRNRIIFSGGVVLLIPEILLEKYESVDSLTVADSTNYDSLQRKLDRARIWAIADRYQQGIRPDTVPIDLSNVGILGMSRSLALSDVPHARGSLEHLQLELDHCTSLHESARCTA